MSDEQVDRLLASSRDAPDAPEIERRWNAAIVEATSPIGGGPLQRVAEEFELGAHDLASIVVAVAPELDARYPVLYAYLQNDVTRKAPSIDLLMRLTGEPVASFSASARIFRFGLLEAVRGPLEGRRPAALKPADALVEFLFDGDSAGLERSGGPKATVIEISPGGDGRGAAEAVARARGAELAAFEGPSDEAKLADFLLGVRLRRRVAYFDAAVFQLDREEPPAAEARKVLRNTLAAPVEAVFEVQSKSPWHPLFEGFDVVTVKLEPPPALERHRLWREALHSAGLEASDAAIDAVSSMFALHPQQIENASRAAARANKPCDYRLLAEVARAQGSSALGSLAVREPCTQGWDRLVLPSATLRRLKELAAAIRDRRRVFEDWGFARSSGGRSGLRAMFTGASGTGKTLSASVIAAELGLDLYRIDLSGVVSKYIGETEKNLERVFRAAEGADAILFFDEADALFGKRTEVKDAHDRYANVEIAYLLQRMESYGGVLVMATNLSKNVDEAFSRRLHFEIEFPMPDETDRLRLWRLLIPDAAPLAEDADLSFVARQFAISGGDIRNAALQAAFLAADAGTDIDMRSLIQAIGRLRLKQGKLPSPSEFKQYYEWTQEEK